MNKIESVRKEEYINHALPTWLTGRPKELTQEEQTAAHQAMMDSHSEKNRAVRDQQDREKDARHDQSLQDQFTQQQDQVTYASALAKWRNSSDDVPFMIDGEINPDLL